MESVLEQRLHNQLLANKHFKTAEDTVRWMLAVQGQDYNPSLWAIGLRTPGLTKRDIERSISEMKIVRSWTMRHTIHFVAIEDLVWMTQLSQERMLNQYKNHMEKEVGLVEETLEQVVSVLKSVLKGKKLVARPKLRTVLEDKGIDTSSQKYYHMLWYAAQKGVIFIGPMEGKQQTIGLVEEWAPQSPFPTREAALKELGTRYLASHGPASAKDLAWWAGLTVGEAKKAIALAGPTRYEPHDDPSSSLYLLPTLDEFLIGYKDRTAALPEENRQWIDPQKRGIYRPLLLDGNVIGSWKPDNKLTIDYQLIPGINVSEALLAQKEKEYAAFFEEEYTLLTQ